MQEPPKFKNNCRKKICSPRQLKSVRKFSSLQSAHFGASAKKKTFGFNALFRCCCRLQFHVCKIRKTKLASRRRRRGSRDIGLRPVLNSGSGRTSSTCTVWCFRLDFFGRITMTTYYRLANPHSLGGPFPLDTPPEEASAGVIRNQFYRVSKTSMMPPRDN